MAWSRVIGSVAAAGALTAFSVWVGVAAGEESPGGGTGCPVVAAAQGVQLMVSNSGDLVLQAPIGAAVPVAQACVNFGLEESTAFASNPYPGSTVVTAPGLVGGLTGESVPDYPWYVSSSYPSRESAEYEEAGSVLRASSTETASDADARWGESADEGAVALTVATASAKVDPASGGSAATAVSDTEPLVINDVLRLGRVHSSAAARLAQGGKIERTSQLEIGRTTVADQEVMITPEGLQVGGDTVGLPDVDPADVLEQAGVTVRYLAAERTANGVLSAGVDIRARSEDPETGAVTTVHYVLGRSFASASAVERPAPAPAPAPAPQGSSGLPPAPETGGSPGAEESGAAAPEALESPGVPADAGQVPEAAPAPASAVAGPAVLAGRPLDIGLVGAYLVIVLAALVMFASGTLLRLLGVKTRWTS